MSNIANTLIDRLIESNTNLILMRQKIDECESKMQLLQDELTCSRGVEAVSEYEIDILKESLNNASNEADDLRKLLAEANGKLEKKCKCKKK